MPDLSLSALLAVRAAVDGRQQEAEQLADKLFVAALPRDASVEQYSAYSFLLLLDEDGYSLWQGKQRIAVDFVSGASAYRRLHGGGRGQPVAKAIGLKAGNMIPSVLDATAGLGGDAFVLASLGCSVRLCERSALVHLLLQDGLARAQYAQDDAVRDIALRMHLLPMDASDYMKQLLQVDNDNEKPDVIFLDPMFPEKQKRAAVKKEMAAFHQLVGADEDADALLPLALQVARCRVVVKRPRHAPSLAEIKPSLVLAGESTRFDIYPLRSMAMDKNSH